MKRLLLLYCLFPFLFCGVANAQRSVWRDKSAITEKKEAVSTVRKELISKWKEQQPYDRAMSLSFSFHTNGWGSTLKYSRGKANTHNIGLGISELIHAKEVKILQENTEMYQLGKRTPFVFGKVNKAYLLQLSYSRDLYLLPSVLNGNMSVGINYGAGLMLALSKPYYIHYIFTNAVTEENYVETIRYSEGTRDQYLNRRNILGAAPWKKGLSEIGINPGITGDASVFIVPGTGKLIKRIAFGGNINYILKPEAILINNPAKHFNPYGYIKIEAGLQWEGR